MNRYIQFLCILSALSVAACQGPTAQEWAEFCSNDRWLEHGYFDATQGISMQVARGYQVRCGDEFSQADLLAYQRGYLKGAIEFCTEEMATRWATDPIPSPALQSYRQNLWKATKQV